MLSKKINIDAELDFEEYMPAGTATIIGIATKESGSNVNGFAEVFVDSLNVYASTSVIGGAIQSSFQVPQKAKSGPHNLTIRVYDTDANGLVLNDASISKEFTVGQVLTELKIIVNNENIMPGNDFTYRANTYDQANDIINEDIAVVIYGPNDVIFEKKLIKPDTEQRILFSLNDTPGYWKIEAKAGEFEKKKLFYVNEIKKIQTSLINNTLIVTNMGNVVYKGPLEITIGSKVEVRQLNLQIGETQKFKLYAPEGNYQISVNDGQEAAVLGNTYLTGNAVRVVDVREGIIEAVGNPVIWWMGAALFILIVALVQVKRRLRSRKENALAQSMDLKLKPTQPSSIAAPSLSIQQGTKENAAVIVLKAQGVNSPQVTDTMNKTLTLASRAGAKIYVEGDYRIILFSKRLTGQDANELLAIKTAQSMEDSLNNHNKMFSDKISFGIGINEGEIISEMKEGHFKFTTIGGLISTAKRISSLAEGKVLLSDSMHRKVINTVRTERVGDGSVWAVRKVTDHSMHSDFLERFKKRV